MIKSLSSIFKRNKGFFLLIILGVSLRIYLLTQSYHVDMLSIAPWGSWIYEHGPLGFYNISGWVRAYPTQPPLANLIYEGDYSLYQNLNVLFVSISTFIALNHLGATHLTWWFDFVNWFGGPSYPGTNIQVGQLLTIKIVSIIADIFIAMIIYKVGKSVKSRFGLLSAFIYFIFPFSWYISALWGQVDQLGFLFLLLSLLLLDKRFFFISAIFLFISIETKPTSLIFIPLYAYLFLQRRPNLIQIISSVSIVIFLFLYTAKLFTDQNLINFILFDLRNKIFLKSEYRLASESFNAWRLLIGSKLMDQDELILLVPGKYLAYLSFLILNLLAFWMARKRDLYSIFSSTFIMGFGGWLFLNNMQERYAFSGVVFGIILLVFRPNLLKNIVLIVLIFSLNLYYSWGFPDNLNFLRNALDWNSTILTRVLAIILIFIFIRVIILTKSMKSNDVDN